LPSRTDEPALPYRLLFTTLNNIDPNEFSITRKIFVGEGVAPKARLVRKSLRREFIMFLRDFDARNSQLQDQLRQFEKKVKVATSAEPEDLLASVYDTIYGLNRSVTSRQNFNGKTVLHYVCALGYAVLLKHILAKKLQTTEINLLDINTRTPLFYAAAFGHDEMVRELIEHGATSHSKDVRGETVTDMAIRLGQIKVVKILNEIKEQQRETASSTAASAPAQSAAAAPPVRNNFTMRGRAPSQLHQAARGGDVGKLSELVQETKTPTAQTPKPTDDPGSGTLDVKNEEGATALHIAAASGNMKAVSILISAGADINAIDDGGSTPLHQAVAANQMDVVKALVEAGAKIETFDDTGGSALNLAASLNHVDIINYLLSKKANINTVNERGFTPLHHACAFGFMEAVQALVAAKASVNAVAASDQSTPLHQAVFNGHHELIVPLVNAGAEINNGDSKALHLACFNGHSKCVEILLQQKAKVSSVDAEKSTAMHKAAYNGHVECMKLLLSAGAKLDPVDNEGATPLHKAAFSGKVDCAKFLIANGASIDTKDAFEGTPLHNAAYQGHFDVAKLLLDKGANLTYALLRKFSLFLNTS
jgi:ankyrin repeat protein